MTRTVQYPDGYFPNPSRLRALSPPQHLVGAFILIQPLNEVTQPSPSPKRPVTLTARHPHPALHPSGPARHHHQALHPSGPDIHPPSTFCRSSTQSFAVTRHFNQASNPSPSPSPLPKLPRPGASSPSQPCWTTPVWRTPHLRQSLAKQYTGRVGAVSVAMRYFHPQSPSLAPTLLLSLFYSRRMHQ